MGARVVLENLAHALGEEGHLRVVFHSNKCQTDGKTIWLPAMTDKLPEEFVEFMRGNLDHEIGHVRYTNMSIFKKIGKKYPTWQYILNIVEDIWTEIEMEAEFPGCKVNFERSLEQYADNIKDKVVKAQPIEQVGTMFLMVARMGYEHWLTERCFDMNPSLRDAIEYLEEEILLARRCKSTKEAARLAKRIIDKLKLKYTKPPEDKPDDGKGEVEAKEGIGDGDKKEEVAKPSGKTGEDEKPSPRKKWDKFMEELSLDAEVEEELSREKTIEDLSDKFEGYRVYSTEWDTFKERLKVSVETALETYDHEKQKISSTATALRMTLTRLLVSQKRSKWLGGKKQGFINPAQMHHVPHGTSERVFRIKSPGKKLNTAVSLLVDQSGSMGGAKMSIARQCAILMAETLHAIGIPFECLGFSGDETWEEDVSSGVMSEYSRWGSLNMIIHKLFTEPFGARQKARMGRMSARTENYDSEAVEFAARRLAERKEIKKVLFVLSDGSPCAGGGDIWKMEKHLSEVAKYWESQPNFYLIAFGIRTSEPSKFYKNHMIVSDIDTLPALLMKNLHKVMVN